MKSDEILNILKYFKSVDDLQKAKAISEKNKVISKYISEAIDNFDNKKKLNRYIVKATKKVNELNRKKLFLEVKASLKKKKYYGLCKDLELSYKYPKYSSSSLKNILNSFYEKGMVKEAENLFNVFKLNKTKNVASSKSISILSYLLNAEDEAKKVDKNLAGRIAFFRDRIKKDLFSKEGT